MRVEFIPKFTDPGATLWTTIPPVTKKLLLSNVWCSTCRDETTLPNRTGVIIYQEEGGST
jgi:hypothetical protein